MASESGLFGDALWRNIIVPGVLGVENPVLRNAVGLMMRL